MKNKISILNLLIIIIVIIIVYILFYLGSVDNVYKKEQKIYETAKLEIVSDNISADERAVDFELLNIKSSSSCAWIYIPGTKIDYPLVAGEDNTYYLTHDAYGNESKSGAIFLNCDNSPDMNDRKTVIFGHNMKDGSMFHDLRYYTDTQFAREHPLLFIYMSDETVRKYEVHSTATVNTNDETVYMPMLNENESIVSVLNYIDKLADNVFNSSSENNFLILSTCQSGDDRRVVVFQECD